MYTVNLYESVLDIGSKPDKTFVDVLSCWAEEGSIVIKFEESFIMIREDVAIEVIIQSEEE